MDITLDRVDEILLKHQFEASSLIAMLQEIQTEAGYLPTHALMHLSQRLAVAPARIRALGTFYKSEGLGLSSTNREHASGKMFGENKETEEIQVPMITLDDLLDREGIEKVDLLAMDIEGHELTALRGFDLERFQPELLVIEGKSSEVKKHLSDHGYEQIQRYARLDPVNRYFRRKQADEAAAN